MKSWLSRKRLNPTALHNLGTYTRSSIIAQDKNLLALVELCFLETRKIIGSPLNPTPPNSQITLVGNEGGLPWTLSRLKWVWPGLKLCDLHCPFVWELECGQILSELYVLLRACTSAAHKDGLSVSPSSGAKPLHCWRNCEERFRLWGQSQHTPVFCRPFRIPDWTPRGSPEKLIADLNTMISVLLP